MSLPDIMFVGERRSARAVALGVTWETGGLAAKQLFDALRALGHEPRSFRFANWFEAPEIVRAHPGPLIALGRVVQRALAQAEIAHTPMIHPAARGAIRKKERYTAHVAECLAVVVETQHERTAVTQYRAALHEVARNARPEAQRIGG